MIYFEIYFVLFCTENVGNPGPAQQQPRARLHPELPGQRVQDPHAGHRFRETWKQEREVWYSTTQTIRLMSLYFFLVKF